MNLSSKLVAALTALLMAVILVSPGSAAQSPTVTSLAPTTRTITQGGTSTFTVTINAIQPTETVIAITSSAPDVAFVPSQVMIPAGRTTALLPVTANTPGTAQIVAGLNGTSVTSSVTVTPAQPKVVSLLPPVTPVLLGASTTLTVTLSAAQPMDTVVTIAGAPSELVAGPPSVVVPAGQISAPVTIAAAGLGTAMVRASLNDSVAEAIIRIVAPAPSLSGLQPALLNLTSGASSQITATLNAVQATDITVALTVDKSTVLEAPAILLIPAGYLHAVFSVTGRAAGSAIVTATVGESSRKVTIQVIPPPPVVVSLVPNPFMLQQGATGSVTVTLNAAQPVETVITLTNTAPALLQVPRSATVPAGRTSAEFPVTGLASGEAVISAAATGAAVSATVQVLRPGPKVVALTPMAVTLPNGTPGVLRVTVSPAPSEPTAVALMSSTPTVAEVPMTVTIPAGALGADVPLATRRPGEATITATLNGGTAGALVTVTAAELMGLALSPPGLTVAVDESRAFQATGTFTDGTTQDVTAQAIWRSSEPTVATLSSGGVATGMAPGTAAMTATVGSLTARATVTVTAQRGRLSLSPAAATVGIGQSLALTVSLAAPGTEAVTVTLTPSGTGSLTVAPSVVVLAVGQTSAPVNVTGTGAGTVTLTASAPGRLPANSTITIGTAPGLPAGAPGRPLTGRVLSATDAKPLAGVRLTLAGQSTTTDVHGQFVFSGPPSGYQLVKIDHASLDAHRKRFKDGSLGGLMHADPVLVNISSEKLNALPDPIWVVQTHATLHPIVPGRKTDIRPAHIPGLTLSIQDGTTIRSEDGQTNSGVAITPLPPDRVPRLPESAAPRTVYLVSFERHGGGIPSKPVPMIAPNEAGADPGTRMQFWYYDKSPSPDPASHQWKLAGYGTVSPDGRSIIPDPGVGQPRFCYAYWTHYAATNITQKCPQDGQNCTAADPVDVTSGVFTLEKTDMVLPGVLPVHITRTYRSKAEGIGPFGQGASFNYDLYLTLVGSALRLQMPDMNRYLFSQEADGKYRNTSYPIFKGAAITRLGSTDELRWRDGTVYVFNTWGYLIEIRDRYNNKIEIIRDGSTSRIQQIKEPSGRALTFAYTTVKRGFSTFDVIASITDPLGRSVHYVYYVASNGRLSRVIDPAGGFTTYTYGEYSQQYYWNEGMLTITDARGITYLRNEYDTSGRVVKQTLADGGVYQFAYTTAG
ncbi:MAG: DUF6531 domain-containing protein, partial [Nitrospirota bacterium]